MPEILAVIALAAALAAPPARADGDLRTYVCHRAAGSITIDGALDDAGWSGTAWSGGFHRFLGLEVNSAQRTLVRATWDDQALYVAFKVYDTDPWATLTKRDSDIYSEEAVEVYIDENGDQRNYREFEVNPLNGVLDALIPWAGAQSSREVRRWDAAGWTTAARVYADAKQPYWVAEMAFPWGIFKEAKRCPPAPGDVWRAQFYRIERLRPNLEATADAWSPTPNFHRPEYFGRLELAG